jgi:hypothetical protein
VLEAKLVTGASHALSLAAERTENQVELAGEDKYFFLNC